MQAFLKICCFAFTVTGVLLVSAGIRAADQATAVDPNGWADFTPTEDTYVKEARSSNYGQRSTLQADNAPSVKRALLRFNIGGIPESATIVSATLAMYTANRSSHAGNLHQVIGSWNEATTIWSNAPSVGVQVTSITGPATVGAWTNADVTSEVTGNGVVDFYLVTPSSDSVYYNSSEAASNFPTLHVEWFDPNSTPLPTATATSTPTITPPPPSTPTPTATSTPTPPPPGTEILSFLATDDATVRADRPDRNYGSSTSLEVDGSPVKDFLLKFSVSGLNGRQPTSAKLRLYAVNPSKTGGDVRRVTQTTWNELLVNWNTAPPGDAVPAASLPAVSINTWYEVDITSLVSGDGIVSVRVTSTASDGADYSSKEGPGQLAPQLWLTVPTDPGAPTPTAAPTEPGAPTPTPTNPGTATPTTAPTDAATPTATPTPLPTEMLAFLTTDDATVRADRPDRNYGSSTSLEVDGSPVKDFLLKFSVSGLNGRQPTSAKLRLYAVNPSNRGGAVREVTQTTWNELLVNWNTAPPGNAVPAASLPAVSINTWYEVDITSLVSGDGIVSVRVTSTASDGADYSSKEGAAQFRPELVVTVPIDPNAPTATPTPTPTLVPTPSDNDPVFVGAGDISKCSSAGDEATANLLDAIPGTVFTLGDNVYQDGTDEEYAECYDPSWGRHRARTKPVIGNHEYGTPGASGYFNYFGAAAGDPSKGYYSYDLGAWHIIALNSECAEVGGCGPGSPQEQWLRADLAANSATCTAALMHRARFSSGSIGNSSAMKPLWEALYDHGADLVLAGHAHDYERFAPQDPSGNLDLANGMREFVVGTGGAFFTGTGTTRANSEVFQNDTFGVLRLTLHPASYEWEFIPEAGRTFTDSGAESCH